MTVSKKHRACASPLAARCFSPSQLSEASIRRTFELLGAQVYSTGALVRFDVWMVELQLELVSEPASPVAPFCGPMAGQRHS